ncbi:GGDEF domain-containing protein [Halioxenophilus sp. WMMB6]|uniref:GGDEF domain-containing protein n=1 Tax=Halioxenophilus sp. WMMB6 TaxID=3073815 RepID=UPI00295F23BA|nr:GGDEF domain-containing protein [Halioxenophilus sp. WMMB6]
MSEIGKPCNCALSHGCCRNQAELEQLQQRVLQLEKQIVALQELVRTDALTGLYNQRYFREALHREIERTQRTGVDFCLVLLDLDFFKKVNDRWGHEVGNSVLQHTASLIKEAVRPMDLPCRYGGEEFAILLPATPLLTSVQVAERIRTTIANTDIFINGDIINITVSCGVCAYGLTSLLTEEQLVDAADKELYRAKNEGRNRVCYAPATYAERQQVSQAEKDLLLNLSDQLKEE